MRYSVFIYLPHNYNNYLKMPKSVAKDAKVRLLIASYMKIKDEFGKSHITRQSIGSDFWFGRPLLRPLQKCPDYRLRFYQITIYNVINVKEKGKRGDL